MKTVAEMRVPGVVFEVERKFRGLTKSPFLADSGRPNFRSLTYLGEKDFADTYFDRNSALSAQGIWLRQRTAKGKNSTWEAKISKGGTFNNSLFEELTDTSGIAKIVSKFTGGAGTESNNFGLDVLAQFTTNRKTWRADEQFKIVLDTACFGHEVGEVELEQKFVPPTSHSTSVDIEKWEQKTLHDMDSQIDTFMKYYSWAFQPGTPEGKLTAYFKRHNK